VSRIIPIAVANFHGRLAAAGLCNELHCEQLDSRMSNEDDITAQLRNAADPAAISAQAIALLHTLWLMLQFGK